MNQFYFSGLHPMALKGTRTGVIVALSSSETCDWWSKDPEIVNGYEYLGTSRTMSANRVSNYFDLKGKNHFIILYTSFIRSIVSI